MRNHLVVEAYVRPYAWLVAGVVERMAFDADLIRFTLEFQADPDLGETEIFVPIRHFGRNPDVSIDPAAAGGFSYDAATQMLTVSVDTAGLVVVTVERES